MVIIKLNMIMYLVENNAIDFFFETRFHDVDLTDLELSM